MRAQWVCSRERRTALCKRSSINQSISYCIIVIVMVVVMMMMMMMMMVCCSGEVEIHLEPKQHSTSVIIMGIVQWLERRTRDWKVTSSNPCRSGGIIFFSRVNFLCWPLFRYPFHPRVTAVARKRSRSFCQRCRWQVTAKHVYTYVCGFAWSDMEHGCMVYTERAGMAAVGTNHVNAVRTPLRWIFKNAL